jgi:hypothetical protein
MLLVSWWSFKFLTAQTGNRNGNLLGTYGYLLHWILCDIFISSSHIALPVQCGPNCLLNRQLLQTLMTINIVFYDTPHPLFWEWLWSYPAWCLWLVFCVEASTLPTTGDTVCSPCIWIETVIWQIGSYSIVCVCVYRVTISLVRFEVFAVLRCNAACIGSYRHFRIACQSHLLGLFETLEDGTDRLSQLPNIYILHNTSEEQMP